MRSFCRALGLALLSLCLGCTERHPTPTPSSPAPGGLELPGTLPGFQAGVAESGPTFVRRTYSRGAAQVTVTLARFAMTPEQYAQWVQTSTASFSQAALDLPAGEGNGFYECAPEDAQRCDLLIQLRSGVHLEIRGNRQATKADADAVAHGLPLQALAH